MSRLGEFRPEHRQYYESMLRFRPEQLKEDLDFIAEAVQTEVSFEPFNEVGDVRRLLSAATNLLLFMERYEEITGSLELPRGA